MSEPPNQGQPPGRSRRPAGGISGAASRTSGKVGMVRANWLHSVLASVILNDDAWTPTDRGDDMNLRGLHLGFGFALALTLLAAHPAAAQQQQQPAFAATRLTSTSPTGGKVG